MKRPGLLQAGLAAAILLAMPSFLHAQTQQYGGPGGNTYATWGSQPPATPAQRIDLYYFIGPSVSGAETALIQQAAAAWSSVGGGVNLIQSPDTISHPISVFVNAANLGATPGTVTPLVVGTTLSGPMPGTYPDGRNWYQINGPLTITVNDVFPFWDGTGVPPGGFFSIDQQAVALDLWGRALGLAPTGGAGSVMQPDSNFLFSVPGNHALSPQDITAVQAVYGTPEPTTLALLGIGLAVLGVSKKFRRTALGL
jgi:hypothetical protein